MTAIKDKISEFLLQLYSDAADCPAETFRLRVLHDLQSLIDFDFALWGGGQSENRQVTDLAALGQDTKILQDWVDVADKDAFCDITLQHLGQVACFDDIEGYRNSLAYNEHWKRYGALQMMATISAEPQAGYVSFIGLCAQTGSKVFAQPARDLKSLLMPHLSNAYRINLQSVLSSMTGCDEVAAITDSKGWILLAQDKFRTFLYQEGAQADRLPDYFCPVRIGQTAVQGNQVAATAQRLGEHYLVRLVSLGSFAGLSARERQIAQFYADGLTYREIAGMLEIAPSTVRNHIARIFEKLEVSSKIELIRLCRINTVFP